MKIYFKLKKPINLKFLLLDDLSEELIEYLELNKDSFLSVKYSKRPFFLSPIFFLLLLKNFLYYLFLSRPNKVKILSVSYYVSLIEYLKPKYIFNFLDNSILFSYIDLKIKHNNFITFQNGFRCELNFSKNNLYYSNICLFSHLDKEKFTKYGCKIDDFFILGPIRALFYKQKKKINTKITNEFDICFISQYPSILNFSKDEFIQKSVRQTISKTNNYLNKLRIKENLRVVILMRGTSEEERDFYKGFGFKNENLLKKNLTNPWQTYDVINKSNITIGFSTSCVQEAWSMEKKGIICDFTDLNLFNYFDLKLIVRDDDYIVFAKKIKELISLSSENYMNKYREELNKYSVTFRKKTLNLLKSKIHD